MDTIAVDTWEHIANQREAFGAQLQALDGADWDRPTLCAGWRVRHVVAHTILPERISPLTMGWELARAGFSVGRFLYRDAIRRGDVPVAELLADYRAGIGRRTTPPGRTPEHVLADLTIHMQDVRRPLGLAPVFDPTVLALVAGTVYPDAGLGVPARVAGLSLRATDTDWRAGAGPQVCGPLEALILAMAGRTVAVVELSGDGVSVLATRLTPATP